MSAAAVEKILCVDDEARNLELLEALLAPPGYRLEFAKSGEEALALLAAGPPDLVLLDIMMPGMSGFEVLEKIRADKKCAGLPVIMVTALRETEQKVRALEAGASDFVSKPYEKPEMLARVRTQLRAYGLYRELAALNKSLESFSYSVAHDLRNPLSAIQSYADFLKKDLKDTLAGQSRDDLEEIVKGARRMDQLIKDLLWFSKLGREEVRLADADMGQLAAAVMEEAKLLSPGRDIEWLVGPLPPALADPALIRHVWGNFVNNAVKYSGKQPKAVIEIGARGSDGGTTYYVRDNGAGFNMADAGKLFGAFQRLHRRDQFEGSGIGLSIVAGIVKKHGGAVTAFSDGEGKGSEFTFTLPRRAALCAVPGRAGAAGAAAQ